jgi:hypothetical protein
MISCRENNSTPSKALISQLKLKRGGIISCGLTDNTFGNTDFEITGDKKTKKKKLTPANAHFIL